VTIRGGALSFLTAADSLR